MINKDQNVFQSMWTQYVQVILLNEYAQQLSDMLRSNLDT